LVPAKFLIGMVLLTVFIFAGGQGVLERGNDSTWAGDMYYFGWGNHPLDRGKWCTWAGEMMDSSN
jgi:hypothetical protein